MKVRFVLPLLFLGASGHTSMVMAQSPGTFTATVDMTTSRFSHTATLLADGTVLIAGGGGCCYGLILALASAELYDPVTGTFSNTGNLATDRREQTATLLNDGRVLIAGGIEGFPSGVALSSAEIYHPGVLVPAPELFSFSGDGRGQGAILHAGTHFVVSSSKPAVAVEALEIYDTGLIDGSVIPQQVAIGGRMAEILFFGKAPGVAGLNQVNVRVPSGIASGDAVPVRLNYIGHPSNQVTISVQ